MSEQNPAQRTARILRSGEIAKRLDVLKDHGFIDGWHREGRRWVIDCASIYGPYSQAQASGWVEGAAAMGAGGGAW